MENIEFYQRFHRKLSKMFENYRKAILIDIFLIKF